MVRSEPVLVDSTTIRLNITDPKVSDAMRQEITAIEDVQVVQELADSQEGQLNPIEQDPSELVGSVTDVIDADKPVPIETNEIDNKPTNDKPLNENDPNPINKYCSCSSASCKCCRDFSIPLIPIRGPGCATVRYLDNDRLSIAIKYGDLVLASRQVDSRRPTPVCIPLPGGYNRFCGRVYGKIDLFLFIQRKI